MNRVGDQGLSIGFFAIFALFGSIDYATVFSLSSYMNETAITVIGLLLLTGAMAKSSQIPLHSWLPGSMEGRLYVYTTIFFGVTYLFIFLFTNLFNFNINNLDILSLSLLPAHLGRDIKGRFIGQSLPLVTLPSKLIEALVGELLGDGHLRFNKKGIDGKPKPNTNAQLAMTLKSKKHTDYLWQDVYKIICTKTMPHPWPNPKTGKPVTQYHLLLRL